MNNCTTGNLQPKAMQQTKISKTPAPETHGGLTKSVCDKGEERTRLIGVLLPVCVIFISSPVPAFSALLPRPPLHQSTYYTQVEREEGDMRNTPRRHTHSRGTRNKWENLWYCASLHSDWRTREEDQARLTAAYMHSSVQAIPEQTPEGNTKSWCGMWSFHKCYVALNRYIF